MKVQILHFPFGGRMSDELYNSGYHLIGPQEWDEDVQRVIDSLKSELASLREEHSKVSHSVYINRRLLKDYNVLVRNKNARIAELEMVVSSLQDERNEALRQLNENSDPRHFIDWRVALRNWNEKKQLLDKIERLSDSRIQLQEELRIVCHASDKFEKMFKTSYKKYQETLEELNRVKSNHYLLKTKVGASDCPVCQKTLANKSGRDQHLLDTVCGELNGLEITNNTCPTCKKKFGDAKAVLNHVRMTNCLKQLKNRQLKSQVAVTIQSLMSSKDFKDWIVSR